VSQRITIVGGGLAGCEAAWQLAHAGIAVDLHEMRPQRGTAAHTSDRLGELVCSNSFRNATLETAVGLLKEEMRRLGSVVMQVADRHRVPAGSCLAVDRSGFAAELTRLIEAQTLVRLVRTEVTTIPSGMTIVASGPLTSAALSAALTEALGTKHLYFYDAIAPTVTADSIDMTVAWKASRYDKGGDDYVNCPFGRDEYYAFVAAVAGAEKVPTRNFERCLYFEGCMPIEEMVRRGPDTLAFGPMRPVGLVDPRTGMPAFACAQLRQDDAEGRLYNMVGFQTKMTYPEQRRVFRMIPGLAGVEFVRLGSLHRNTYVDAPSLLLPSLQVAHRKHLVLAGQIVGVEGYVESAATGLLAGLNVARMVRGEPPTVPPRTTALGSLLAYITQRGRKDFQPMNANYGLFPPLGGRLRGREKKLAMAERSLSALARWREETGLTGAPAGSASVA
jgi:methylenetetrahydrofolate--tRNA-(uracil-5-)-methyltransferase